MLPPRFHCSSVGVETPYRVTPLPTPGILLVKSIQVPGIGLTRFMLGMSGRLQLCTFSQGPVSARILSPIRKGPARC